MTTSEETTVKKGDAEKAVRSLVTKWVRETWRPAHGDAEPSQAEFIRWLSDNRPDLLDFRTTVADPYYFVYQWFDSETGQSWKN